MGHFTTQTIIRTPPIRVISERESVLEYEYSLCHNEVIANVPGSRERLAQIKQELDALRAR